MEVWKDVLGYEGLYQVSDLGSIRSFQQRTPRILKRIKTRYGYLTVGLSRDGIQKHKFVHRLVYEAFNGPFEQESVYNMVDHINRDRADPRLVNLRASNATLNCLNNGGKGYSFHKQSLKYDVRIYKFGKITTFGSFVTEEEAAAHAIKVKAENYALHAKHYEKLEATRVR
jgi:hypothetical protein